MKKITLILITTLLPIVSCSNNNDGSKNQAYLELAYESIVIEDYHSAIENFNKAIEVDPESVEAYNMRGLVLGIMGDYSSALADFNRSIQIDPNNAEAYKSRGITKLHLKQKAEGCKDLTQAAKLGYAGGYDLVNEFCK